MRQQFLTEKIAAYTQQSLFFQKKILANFAENRECNLYRKAMAVVILSLPPFFSPRITFHREKQ
jgi:hypothetical protein